MARIPQAFIDELLERTEIVEIIEARVPLRRKGREYAACCPFHEEKTPSFYVSPQKQFYHCFGCGAHGTALSFLMDHENMEFRDAVRELAERAGMEIPQDEESDPVDRSRDQRLREALAHADRFYRARLRESEAAKDYLRGRGIRGETAYRFGIGWAPDRWDALLETAAPDPELHEALLATGMLVRKEESGRCWDRFRSRIMFPIRDGRGRTVAFGGRILGDGKPKYLNSPEHPLFHKGRELYGLHEARQACRNLDSLLITEGYMDVIGLAEAGIDNAAATLGTATTPDQLNRAFRVVPRVVFCFDGDAAGRRAAWKALENSLGVLQPGREVRFLFLPEGEDPDSLVRQEGAARFKERIEQARPLSEWFCTELGEGLDLATPEGRAGLLDRAAPRLEQVRDPVYRDLLVEALAGRAGMDVTRWKEMLAGRGRRGGTAAPEPKPTGPRRTSSQARGPDRRVRSNPVRHALRILLQEPGIAAEVRMPPGIGESGARGIEILVEMLETVRQEPGIRTAQLLDQRRGRREHPHLEELARQPVPGDEEALRIELQEILDRLGGPQRVTARMEVLLEKAQSGELSDAEKTELRELQQARAEQ